MRMDAVREGLVFVASSSVRGRGVKLLVIPARPWCRRYRYSISEYRQQQLESIAGTGARRLCRSQAAKVGCFRSIVESRDRRSPGTEWALLPFGQGSQTVSCHQSSSAKTKVDWFYQASKERRERSIVPMPVGNASGLGQGLVWVCKHTHTHTHTAIHRIPHCVHHRRALGIIQSNAVESLSLSFSATASLLSVQRMVRGLNHAM